MKKTIEKNKNYQRIDNLIVTAYRDTIKAKGNSDISITELCKRANVNRTTFYKHYQGIYEITNQLESELLYHLFEVKEDQIIFVNFLKNPKLAFDRLNHNLLENLDYYRKFFRPERTRYIIDKINDAIMDTFKKAHPKISQNPKSLMKMKTNIAYFVGATVNLYLQWLRGYINTDINYISDFLCRVITTLYPNAHLPE